MSTPLVVLLALLLDAALGEPRWLWSRLPHPAVLMGRAVGWADRHLNRGSKLAGIVTMIGLVVLAGLCGGALAALGGIVETIGIAILLAQRSLVAHVAAVSRDLRMTLPAARRAVAMIVSRDTTGMTRPEVARAAIESAAENLSDGVIAPAFWALIGGLPGIAIYKVVNTADSMIGYRTPRHKRFGWAAARLDDALNWVPARLTAMLLWLVGGAPARWGEIAADARRHKSPNAGWPEAVMSRSLGIALAGPRTYHGVRNDLPWVNGTGRRDIGAAEIDSAIRQLWSAWALLVMVVAPAALLM